MLLLLSYSRPESCPFLFATTSRLLGISLVYGRRVLNVNADRAEHVDGAVPDSTHNVREEKEESRGRVQADVREGQRGRDTVDGQVHDGSVWRGRAASVLLDSVKLD